jgi:DnaD/phage-associated family protein
MRALEELGLISCDDDSGEAPGSRARERTAPSPGVTSRDSAFSFVVQETQLVLGKTLSSDDLERLCGVYDTLGLPPDVILQLVNHCAEETRRGRGEDKKPTMRYIEKAAYIWQREGIFTLALAEEYIRRLDTKRSAAAEVRKALNISARDLSPSEAKYIDAWLALGVTPDAIAIAYDRTVVNTGKLTWKYMDSIINSWHGQGLHTAQEIMAKDTKQSKDKPRDAKPAPTEQERNQEIAHMERMIERMKQSGDGDAR